MFGSTRSRTKARTVSRIKRSSSVSSASIPRKSVGDGAGTFARCVSGFAVVLMEAPSVARAPLLVIHGRLGQARPLLPSESA